MSKIRRNEPCPCGSGKKYKKCCGVNNAITFNTTLVNKELYQIQQELISFALNKYKHKMNEQFNLYSKALSQVNNEITEIYQAGLTLWIIFNARCLENNQTIFDAYCSHNTSNISEQARDTLVKWQNRIPGIYEIKSIDHDRKFIAIKELFTHKSGEVPFENHNDFQKGSFIVGTVIPFVNHYNFFYTMIKLYQHDKEQLLRLVEVYSSENGGMKEHFPNFLADALILGIHANKQENPLHEEVAQLFTKHMTDKNMDEALIVKGANFWKQYCEIENPVIKKIDGYAAALEYFVQKSYGNETTITQAKLAEDYNVSSGTVSANYRKLTKTHTEQIIS